MKMQVVAEDADRFSGNQRSWEELLADTFRSRFRALPCIAAMNRARKSHEIKGRLVSVRGRQRGASLTPLSATTTSSLAWAAAVIGLVFMTPIGGSLTGTVGPSPLLAQTLPTQPVEPWADWASYGTALVNPTIAAVEAWKSPRRGCRLGQLAISEAVGNVAALTIKHFVMSARPCFMCQPDGMPSGHTMNSTIGLSASRFGFSATIATGGLRMAAHRHTPLQVLAGGLLGLGAEGAGHLLRCKE